MREILNDSQVILLKIKIIQIIGIIQFTKLNMF